MSKTQVLQRRGTIYRFQASQTELFIVFPLEQIGVLLIPDVVNNEEVIGCLQIEYKNRSIEKVCVNASAAERKYGSRMAELIQQRIDQIRSADSVEQMIQFKIGRCHPLHQNREGQYAVDLVHPQRIVFTKKGMEIEIAYIIEIIDYH